MLKTSIQIVFFLFCTAICNAQERKIDSLNRLIQKATSDTQRINLVIEKAYTFELVNLDSSIQLENKVIRECQTINYIHGECLASLYLGSAWTQKGDFTLAKKNLDKAGEFLKTTKDSSALFKYYFFYGVMYYSEGKVDSSLVFYKKAISTVPQSLGISGLTGIYTYIGDAYQDLVNFPDALTYYQKALSIAEKVDDERREAHLYSGMADLVYLMGDNVKAERYGLNALKFAKRTRYKFAEGTISYELSYIYIRMLKYKEAYTYGMNGAGIAKTIGKQTLEVTSLSYAAKALAGLHKLNEAEKLNRKAMAIADSSKQPLTIYSPYSTMGSILKMEGKDREAIPFYEKSLQSISGIYFYDPDVADDYSSLSECYEKTGSFNKALAAYKAATKIRDTLKNMQNIRKTTELAVSYDFKKKQELAKAIQDKKDADTKRLRTKQYFIIAGLGVIVFAFIAIALIQLRNNKQKQKANILLERQKQKVEIALSELKSTQSQLIQSEKMASLGELTAGIAHEIQNPLNFVNNFSEVNKELISELVEEVGKGNTEEVKAIANDIKANSEKINHHGKRADAIVKGMLQHSQANAGRKEPTDINKLANEYLRLSFHGIRAKDKDFNTTIKTDFDKDLSIVEGNINIIPQDIGRVLLNLYNNAFYAVNEKKKTADENYKPEVSIQTKKINDKVEIKISDSGNGIPQNIIDKIFQPFFTTKPTGQGTGLGLSLSYDIIKAHGGEIKVNTKENEGTEFTIDFPI